MAKLITPTIILIKCSSKKYTNRSGRAPEAPANRSGVPKFLEYFENEVAQILFTMNFHVG